MFTMEPGADRYKLGFEQAVLENFKFLGTYGLKPVKRGSTLVRYESRRTFVNIYHGRASYEIGVEVGRRDRPEEYGLGYMVAWAGKAAWEAEGFGRHTMFQVNSPEGVREFVPKVAELLKKYGDPFLRGDSDFYDELDRGNQRASADYTRRQQIEAVRKEAQSAWSAKHFARVVKLYQSICNDLTAIEDKRLTYASKKVGS